METYQILFTLACALVAGLIMSRLAKLLDIPYEKWLAAIEKNVKPRFVDLNKAAFEMSYQK